MIARVDCYVADVIHNVCYCCFSPCAVAVLDWACVVQSGWCLPNWFILALHLSVCYWSDWHLPLTNWSDGFYLSNPCLMLAICFERLCFCFDFWLLVGVVIFIWISLAFLFGSFRWSGFFFCVFVLLLFCFLFRLLLKFVVAKLFWNLDCRGCLSMHALSRYVSTV